MVQVAENIAGQAADHDADHNVAVAAVAVPVVADTAADKDHTVVPVEGQHTAAAGDTWEDAFAAVDCNLEEAADTGNWGGDVDMPGLGQEVLGIPIVAPWLNQSRQTGCNKTLNHAIIYVSCILYQKAVDSGIW